MSCAYPRGDWDAYAQSFQSIMPSSMLQLNREVAASMHGKVADFGCGAAKIAPFVLEQADVSSYMGIDFAPQMVQRARWLLAQFPGKPSEVIEARIEDAPPLGFDAGLSINSYYAWPQPRRVLTRIFACLRAGATFMLVTPNPGLDMAALLRAADKELIAHPHWRHFKKQNLAFCANPGARFVTMDTLIADVRHCGFEVVEAHQHWYAGGLNMLHLVKPE